MPDRPCIDRPSHPAALVQVAEPILATGESLNSLDFGSPHSRGRGKPPNWAILSKIAGLLTDDIRSCGRGQGARPHAAQRLSKLESQIGSVPASFTVPLKVEVKAGRTWAECKLGRPCISRRPPFFFSRRESRSRRMVLWVGPRRDWNRILRDKFLAAVICRILGAIGIGGDANGSGPSLSGQLRRLCGRCQFLGHPVQGWKQMKAGKAFTTAICAILVGATSSPRVLGQIAPAPQSPLADSSGDSQPPPPRRRSARRKTPAETMRVSASHAAGPAGRPRPISSSSTGSAPFLTRSWHTPPAPVIGPTTEVLNATDLHQGFSGGPRLSLIHHGDDDGDLEFSYFQIDGWNSYQSIGPTPNGYVGHDGPRQLYPNPR